MTPKHSCEEKLLPSYSSLKKKRPIQFSCGFKTSFVISNAFMILVLGLMFSLIFFMGLS